MNPDFQLCRASQTDIDDIVRVTNAAYVVESFCIAGPRTQAEDVAARMQKGEFWLLRSEKNEAAASVYLEHRDSETFMAMLAVHPDFQGRKLALRLLSFAEQRTREMQRPALALDVVNVRTELAPFYLRQGFVITGEAPFARPEICKMPLHMILMRKTLQN